MKVKTSLVWVALMGSVSFPLFAAPTQSETLTSSALVRCYEQSGENLTKKQACIKKELKAVQEEYKNITERVLVLAKIKDKANKNRETWNSMIRADQNFDAFVRYQCKFDGQMSAGNKMAKEMASDICMIGLYRSRSQRLAAHYLQQESIQ